MGLRSAVRLGNSKLSFANIPSVSRINSLRNFLRGCISAMNLIHVRPFVALVRRSDRCPGEIVPDHPHDGNVVFDSRAQHVRHHSETTIARHRNYRPIGGSELCPQCTGRADLIPEKPQELSIVCARRAFQNCMYQL